MLRERVWWQAYAVTSTIIFKVLEIVSRYFYGSELKSILDEFETNLTKTVLGEVTKQIRGVATNLDQKFQADQAKIQGQLSHHQSKLSLEYNIWM